jgi:hypothetical protein
MLSLEMAIVLTELTRARRVEGEAPPEDRSMEACRSARSGLLALTAGFCIVGLFVLGLDVYTAQSVEPGADQLASQQFTRHGVSE